MARNQIFITIDSLRYDVFEAANLPFLKSNEYAKAFTQATYTLPAHMAFFTGKLPCTFSGKFDTVARSNRKTDSKPVWRLANAESKGPAGIQVTGKDVIDGFNKKGYTTIGTGAVGWFNSEKESHLPAVDNFQKYKWFGEFIYANQQAEFVKAEIEKSDKPYFAFINFGETHHPFKTKESDPKIKYGNFTECFEAQKKAVEYLDPIIEKLFEGLENYDAIICADHGECLGEDGLWGHSFYHEKIMTVPILQISTKKSLLSRIF